MVCLIDSLKYFPHKACKVLRLFYGSEGSVSERNQHTKERKEKQACGIHINITEYRNFTR